MSNKVLGLDLGTNSLGWALLEETDGKQQNIIALGSRIFIKSVEEKTPTPKNVKRRDARMARRIVQRRAKRKQEMLDYLIRLKLVLFVKLLILILQMMNLILERLCFY